MQKIKRVGILAIILISGCASTANQQPRGAAAYANDPRLGEQVKRICFNRSIDGFSEARRDTVVLHKGASDEYLVEVFGGCPNLRDAGSIGFDSTSTCVRRSDVLVISRSEFSLRDEPGLGPQRCSIKAIYKWNKNAKAESEQ